MSCCRVDVLSPVYESGVDKPLEPAPEQPEKTAVGKLTYKTLEQTEDYQDESTDCEEEMFFTAPQDVETETVEFVNSHLGSRSGNLEVGEEPGVSRSHLRADFYDFFDELEREKEEALRPLTSGIMETGMDESGDYKRQVSNESLKDPQVQALSQQLKEWINDVLTDDHIVVKNLCEDLSDGQVLSALIEKLASAKIEHKEVAQSIASQKAKLTEVLNQINYHLQVADDGIKWNVDNIHNKYLISVLHLLVALARHYGIPRRLPSFVKIQVLQITKATQQTETITEQITGDEEREHYNFAARQQERDVFDTLFDSAPDKLNAVKGSLMAFANKQLSQINRGCSNIEEDFSNGVNLVVMMSLAEGYYVPMYSFSMEPTAYDHKLHNVTLALNLMQEAGIPRPKCTAESIVSKDLKSTLRVLYAIYSKYKHLVK